MKKRSFVFFTLLATVLLCFVSCLKGSHSIDQLLRGLKVTYNSNYEGGPSERVQYLSVVTDAKKVLEKNSFARTGYTFLGWAGSSDSSRAEYADESEVNFSKDKVLYAVWKMNSYTLYFEANGGNIDTEESLEVTYEQAVALPHAERDGFVFAGWYKDSSFKTKVVGNTVKALNSEDGGNAYLYARWVSEEDIIYVTYQSNYPLYEAVKEKEDESKTQPVIPNEPNYLDENTFSVDGYKFTGWRDSATNEKYDDKAEVTFDRARTLLAQWEPIHYTIVFNGNAPVGVPVQGSVATMSNIAYNSTEPLNSPLTMTRDGYDFMFWSVGSADELAERINFNSETGYDHKAGHLSTVDGATVTLYANWKTEGVVSIEIEGDPFESYTYTYREEIDFSNVQIWIHYQDPTADRLVSYNSTDFHYSMTYENGQVQRAGVNGSDIPGTDIQMTIYYGPGEVFSANVEQKFTISKATVDITAPEAKVYTYDKNAKVLVNEGSIIHSVIGNEVTDMHFEYRVNGGAYSAEIPEATNAGVYAIDWQIVVDDNQSACYDLSGEILSGSFETTINPANVNLTWTVGEYTYNTQEQGPTAVIESGVIGGDTVNVNVAGKQAGAGQNLVASASLTNSNYTITNPTQIYSIAKKTVTVTAAPTAKELTYNKHAQVLANEGVMSDAVGAKMQYSLTEGNYADSVPSQTNAGSEYRVYWRAVLKDSNNYVLSGTTSGNISTPIKQKEVGLTWTNTNLTYNGSAQKPTATATNVINGDTVTVTVSGEQTNASNSSYTAVATALSNTNYKLPSNVIQQYTIGQKAATTITAPSAKNLTYSGSAQTLLNAGSVKDGSTVVGKVQYSTTSASSGFADTIPSSTNAGSTTVYWKAVITNNNYQLPSSGTTGSVTGTIGKKTATITAPSAKNLTYSGSAQTLLNAGSVKDGSTVVGKVQYSTTSASTGFADTIPSSTNAGNTTVYWKAVISNNNYQLPSSGTTGNVAVTIGKKTATITAPAAKSGLTYSGSAQTLLNAGSVKDGSTVVGKIQYSTTSATATDFSDTIPSSTNAGSTTVYWKAVITNNNYQLPSSGTTGSVTGTIGKKTATITAPSAKNLAYSGSAKTLLNAGSVKDGSTAVGKVQYSTTSASTGFADTIPSSTNVGSTTVYWKAVITNNNYQLPGSGTTGTVTGTIDVALPGEFIVDSSGTKVRFTSGNLYWNGSKLLMESNQYDYRTLSGKKSVIGGVFSETGTPNNHVGSFYWSSSSDKARAQSYSDDNRATTDEFAFKAPMNAGSKNLFTLSNLQFEFLVNNGRSAGKLGFAKVKDIKGLVLLPINWILPSGCTFDSQLQTFEDNTYNETQWENMEANGAVFFPAVSKRNREGEFYNEISGFYWSKNCYPESAGYAYGFFFNPTDYNVVGVSCPDRYYGACVRLVCTAD